MIYGRRLLQVRQLTVASAATDWGGRRFFDRPRNGAAGSAKVSMNPNFSVRNVYGDHMVFQRGMPIRIVGTAPAGLPVTLRFAGRSLSVLAAADGNWEAEFPAMEAGGPYELMVANTIGSAVTFRDILIGEVWFCSGQSNMEF